MGTRGWWNPADGSITCTQCQPERERRDSRPLPSVPGASAQRKADRLVAAEQIEWRQAGWLKKAGIVWRDEPSKARPWIQGAEGERLLGSKLNQLHMQGHIVALHDLRVPRTSANIDHIAVAASGIHVIDAKYYRNKHVEVVDRGGILRRDVQLRVAKRNRTNLVDKLCKQILVVDSVTRDAKLPTQITAVLCFVHALWDFFKKEHELNGVHIVPPLGLERLLLRPGPLSAEQVTAVGELLRARLRPA